MSMNLSVPADDRPARPAPVLRLDKTKKFSTVHGERQPDDPHYKVHFWQDDLPFDANGRLIQDDGLRQPRNGLDAENKPVVHRPLYDDKRAAKAKGKLDRLTRSSAMPVEETSAEEDPEAAAAEQAAAAEAVNFESWLRGEVEYEPWQLNAAYEKRFSRKAHKVFDMVIELVIDEKIVPEEELTPRFQKMVRSFDKGQTD